MPKQASISSFFKPKNVTGNATSAAEKSPKKLTPKKLTPKTINGNPAKKSKIKPEVKADEKENVNKRIQDIEIKSDEDSDDEIGKPKVSKGRRAKFLDSSDSETEKPAKKKQKMDKKIKEELSQRLMFRLLPSGRSFTVAFFRFLD